jgi:hypothetical protein
MSICKPERSSRSSSVASGAGAVAGGGGGGGESFATIGGGGGGGRTGPTGGHGNFGGSGGVGGAGRGGRGLAAESCLDTGNRSGFFNNGGAYLEAHPDFRPKHWAETCVPLVFEGAAVQKARGDLRDRAVALGYALTDDPDVHAVVDGQRVEPARLGAERVAFLLPEGGSHIELRSRTFIPAHITPENPDTRSLGLCVFRLQIDGEVAALDDEAQFRSGWNELERTGAFRAWPTATLVVRSHAAAGRNAARGH